MQLPSGTLGIVFIGWLQTRMQVHFLNSLVCWARICGFSLVCSVAALRIASPGIYVTRILFPSFLPPRSFLWILIAEPFNLQG